MKRLSLIAMAAVMAAGCRPAVIATTHAGGSCRAGDTYALNLLSYMTELATATDAEGVAQRRAFGLAPTPASAVSLVTDSAVCAQAAEALRRETDPEGSAPRERVTV